MDLDKLQVKLVQAARAEPPGSTVPYAFEKRVMARLPRARTTDPWAYWSQALWRAAVPCIAITFLLGVWTAVQGPAAPTEDLSSEFESTVLAAAHQESFPENTW